MTRAPRRATSIDGHGGAATPGAAPTDAQERAIHRAAAAIVAAAVLGRAARLPDPTLAGAADRLLHGVFVSLKRRGQLRGCCGVFGEPTPLREALECAATRTATDDPRMPPVSPTELRYLDLEVWLLSAPQVIGVRGEARRAAVEVGRHGLHVRSGGASALLLPRVAVEHGLDAEGFLEQVCLKAGLARTAWKAPDVQLWTFEGRAIAGPFDPGIADAAAPPARVTEAEGPGVG